MKVLGSSLSHIDAIVEGGGNYSPWHLTGFYGNPETSKRVESWQLLNSLCSVSHLLCLFIRYFNEIRCAEEKERELLGHIIKWLALMIRLIFVG